MEEDIKFMNEAIRLSKLAKYPYGAVIVRKGKIIGRSSAKTPVSSTIFEHSSMVALEDALQGYSIMGNLKGCTLYSSMEPCMMCMEAIMYSGIDRLVYGVEIEASNLFYNHIEDFSVMDFVKKVKPDLEIVGNICRDEALNVIKEYNNKFIEEDNKFIDMAIDISKTAYYPFGAIVVRNGKIIGKSTDDTPIKNTLYTHAELIAIESAVSNIKDSISRGNLHQCTLYTSCEPCMMCMEAILSEGISRVVYAATIEDSIEYFCDEFAVPFEEIVEKSNCKIKIIPELHRDKAIEVLKKHGRL